MVIGEDRGERLREALAAIHLALVEFARSQHVQYLQIGQYVLAGLAVEIGGDAFARFWQEALPDVPVPRLHAEMIVQNFAQRYASASQEALGQRLAEDDELRQELQALLALTELH